MTLSTHRWAKILAFNLALFCVCVLAVELFLTLFFDRRIPQQRTLKTVPEIDMAILAGHLDFEWPAANYIKPFEETRPFRYRIITDEHGARVGPGQEHNRPHDLVVLGDSFSFGAHAEYADSLQGVLEASLPNYNIYNFAVSGSHSALYPRQFNYFCQQERVRPDIVVLGIYVDMQIGDLPRRIATSKYGPYKSFRGIAVSPSQYRKLTQSKFEALRFEIKVRSRQYSSIYNILFPPKSLSEFAQSLYPDFRDADLGGYRRALLSSLREIRAASGLTPDRILIWLVPSNHELKHYLERDATSALDRRFNDLSREFWTETSEGLQSSGFQVVDPRGAFKNAFISRNVYGFTVDGHLNVEGFAIVAEMILHRLRALDLTPPQPSVPGRATASP